MTFTSSFIFVGCQVGAEGALKRELGRNQPELRFAYSRPGFLTFKKVEGEMDLGFTLNSIFGRVYGLSMGSCRAGELAEIIESIEKVRIGHPDRKVRLHVWEREVDQPEGGHPLDILQETPARVPALEAEIRARCGFLEKSTVPQDGDLVVDLVFLDGDQVWRGVRQHSSVHTVWPGGLFKMTLPPSAPSRAYLKLEEVIAWSRVAMRRGDTAVELGSAPGGACLALLERGPKVVGIDPGQMDPRVLAHPSFKHFPIPVGRVPREDLPASIEWLLLDMNVEPRVSLFAVDRLASRMKDSLLGVLLTIKLNQWKIAEEIPAILDHVKAMGMVRVRAAQLSQHRQEFVIYGLTRKGATRG